MRDSDAILPKKLGSWEEFFKLMEAIEVPEDFMTDRDNEPPQERDQL